MIKNGKKYMSLLQSYKIYYFQMLQTDGSYGACQLHFTIN